jgi:hypothetical protein
MDADGGPFVSEDVQPKVLKFIFADAMSLMMSLADDNQPNGEIKSWLQQPVALSKLVLVCRL